ncbi:hypothetical protein OYT1_ch1151 [Ferriphaselus amnicola]|uniref:Uncharacterized protein n=1 Tax=Ferriphaselus amnicola TaxID=1188319 RepID=A0A2Z6GAV9_9PROT|nr:hypothetical protein [Ferriphaselus amnicola]BBE50711.1 hypothetical protein OYT1_ch1151 [Ferriphaselus amnicola]
MEQLLIAMILAIGMSPALVGATDIGASISIGQPGFYGRLDIGDYPPPQLIYRQPRYIERGAMERQPIYLRVPRSHSRNWKRHCRQYNACGERVYFVQEGWYNREYAPRYQERHHGRGGEQRAEHPEGGWSDRHGGGREH